MVCTVYYTDGSVDPETKTSGAAVYSEVFSSCWRTSDEASAVQTELVVIIQALTHSIHNHRGSVTIYTNSKSAIQLYSKKKNK